MMSETLISVKNLSKKFSKDFKKGGKIGLKIALRGLFGKPLPKDLTIEEKEFYALKDINLEVKRGEALGLFGRNGAGKSTLLKHLGGIYLPNTGEIKIKGHVEGLIELGAGFHPLLSGIDNIKQRCAMLQLSEEESDKLMREIIDFSELEEFIEMPVQNYSSGMKARLGFASAVLTKPDVLLIDEALSVGDFDFQQKCLAKINQIKEDVAIIFVSHSIQTMKMFCSRGIVFEKGQMVFSGGIDAASDFYLNQDKKQKQAKEDESKNQEIKSFSPDEEFYEDYVVGNSKHPILGQQVEVIKPLETFEYWWSNENGEKVKTFQKSDPKIILNLKFKIASIENDNDLEKIFIGVPLWRLDNNTYVTAFNSDKRGLYITEPGEYCIQLKFDNIYNYGKYYACVAFQDGPQYLMRQIIEPFEVLDINPRDHGIVRVTEDWVISKN